MKTETKNTIKMLIISAIMFAMAVAQSSCTTNRYTHLHYSGEYVVESVSGDTVKFRNVREKYVMPGTNFKPGQKVFMQKTNDQNQASDIPVKK